MRKQAADQGLEVLRTTPVRPLFPQLAFMPAN